MKKTIEKVIEASRARKNLETFRKPRKYLEKIFKKF